MQCAKALRAVAHRAMNRGLSRPFLDCVDTLPPTKQTASVPLSTLRNRENAVRLASGVPPDKMVGWREAFTKSARRQGR